MHQVKFMPNVMVNLNVVKMRLVSSNFFSLAYQPTQFGYVLMLRIYVVIHTPEERMTYVEFL